MCLSADVTSKKRFWKMNVSLTVLSHLGHNRCRNIPLSKKERKKMRDFFREKRERSSVVGSIASFQKKQKKIKKIAFIVANCYVASFHLRTQQKGRGNDRLKKKKQKKNGKISPISTDIICHNDQHQESFLNMSGLLSKMNYHPTLNYRTNTRNPSPSYTTPDSGCVVYLTYFTIRAPYRTATIKSSLQTDIDIPPGGEEQNRTPPQDKRSQGVVTLLDSGRALAESNGCVVITKKKQSRLEIQSPLVNSVPLVHHRLYPGGWTTQPCSPTFHFRGLHLI